MQYAIFCWLCTRRFRSNGGKQVIVRVRSFSESLWTHWMLVCSIDDDDSDNIVNGTVCCVEFSIKMFIVSVLFDGYFVCKFLCVPRVHKREGHLRKNAQYTHDIEWQVASGEYFIRCLCLALTLAVHRYRYIYIFRTVVGSCTLCLSTCVSNRLKTKLGKLFHYNRPIESIK